MIVFAIALLVPFELKFMLISCYYLAGCYALGYCSDDIFRWMGAKWKKR